ncbi:hypothetical protein AB835_14335 [Candidatus Endobugula sertula]|uniref:DUF2333 domain-containing protein n=1 Tax=Candidatus Endobugula sertula TaxID=62101 RepID=A0A1D2QLG1_9GAMM|nr:hypothetical protein AB835_14335 [Candidatus Endobugula sertula]
MAFKEWFSQIGTRFSNSYMNCQDRLSGQSSWVRLLLGVLLVYLLLILFIGFYWSAEPKPFDITTVRAQSTTAITGDITTSALIQVASTLLDKRGGYLSNDVFPPGIWLDNLPNWEYGALIQVRDLSRALREVFSRSQSQSTEDEDLVIAEPRFNFDTNSWILPSSESVYRKGIIHLEAYRQRLIDTDHSNAQFYARADNLSYWLATVESRLGSLSQRLSASVGQRRINTDLAGEENASQATPAPNEMIIKTSWFQIDDVFYESRGSAWALIHFLKAAEVDFADVLKKKNALISLRQIIRELEETQKPVYSLMILNGNGFGVLANHSLVMASYLSRAHAAIIDIRELLAQG